MKKTITATAIVALIAFAAFILIGMYPDVLVTAQDRNTFSADSLFLSETLSQPFGLFKYAGGFLTQFFFLPALGASLLIVIWAASAFAGIKAFRLQGMWRALMIIPVACLLASMVDLGYWIYCLNITGYWFSQSLAYLCLMLMLWAASATPRRLRFLWYVVAFVLFPVLGWFSYLFGLCFAFMQIGRPADGKAAAQWYDGTGAVLTFIAPLVFRALLYKELPVDDIFSAGFPLFVTSTNESLRPSIPFFIMGAVTVLLSFGRLLPSIKKVPAFAAYFIVGVASAAAVWNSMFLDDNYIYEMQMTQASLNDDWQRVVSVSENTTTPSRTMVMLKNIALMNTGELGKRSFELGNSGIEIKNPDSLYVNIMQIAAPVIYYNYGMANYAMRWCMGFGVSYGFSPYYLRVMSRSAEATGEKKLAERYANRLNGLLFYRDWKPLPASPMVKELRSYFTDVLTTDNNNCELYIIKTFNFARKEDSSLISELSLLNSMIARDVEQFSTSLLAFAKLCDDDYLPRHYEEAYCLLSDKDPDKFPYRISISESTIQRYQSFLADLNRCAEYSSDAAAVSEMLRSDWGDTYWWFNAFGRNNY